MGIEEILNDLNPKTHDRFIQRDYSKTYATSNGGCIVLTDDESDEDYDGYRLSKSYRHVDAVGRRLHKTSAPPPTRNLYNRSFGSTISSVKSSKSPRITSGKSSFERDLLRKLLRSVGYMIEREQSENLNELVVAEWRMVAFVLDRLAFWIFAIFTVFFIVIFLIVLPLSQHAAHRHNGTLMVEPVEEASESFEHG